MLVSAFAGYDHVRALYRHAIEARYRFFSYGDAMLLARRLTAQDGLMSSTWRATCDTSQPSSATG